MSRFDFNTFGSVTDEIGNELLVDLDTSSISGLSRSAVEKFANRHAKKFISKVDIVTQEATWPIEIVADTTLNDASADSGDTTITLTAAPPSTSGMLLLDDVPMTYTYGGSGNDVTVPALARGFDDGAVVRFGYSVPDDFMRPRLIEVNKREHLIARRGDDVSPSGNDVTIYGDYLFLPSGGSAGTYAIIHYLKTGTTLTSSETMEIMDMFDEYVIYKGTARGHRLMYDNDRAAEYEQMAEQSLMDAREFFAKLDGSYHNAFLPDF